MTAEIDLSTLERGCMITLRNGEEWEVKIVERSWLTYHDFRVVAHTQYAYHDCHYYKNGTVNNNGFEHPEDIVNVAPF